MYGHCARWMAFISSENKIVLHIHGSPNTCYWGRVVVFIVYARLCVLRAVQDLKSGIGNVDSERFSRES